MTKYESETQYVDRPVEAVYTRFSHLSELENLKKKLENPETQQEMAQKVGDDRTQSILKALESASFEDDRITLTTPMGAMSLVLVEKEAPKLLKFGLEGAPLEAHLWIQLLPASDTTTRFKITLGVELNFFMKQMVGSKLKDAVKMIAETLRTVAATA